MILMYIYCKDIIFICIYIFQNTLLFLNIIYFKL